jgi:RimJ/RimL family protein N-acetyltransferase
MNSRQPAAAVAVQRLNPRHLEDIVRHLLQLPPEDRRLRFGNAVRDDAVRAYVSGLDFDRDRVFGILGDRLDLVGVAHLALDPGKQLAELGVSVDPACRGNGYGFALLERVVLHAANAGYRTLFMVCLAENQVMMHLARKAGLRVVIESGEADARMRLVQGVHGGALREAVADQLALVDTMLKQQHLWLQPPAVSPAGAPILAPQT